MRDGGGEGVSEQDDVAETGLQGLAGSRSEAGVGSDVLIVSPCQMEPSTGSTISRLSLLPLPSCEADELIEEIESLGSLRGKVGSSLDPKVLNRLLTCIERRDIALDKETRRLASVERKYAAALEALEARERVLEELGRTVETLEGMSETAKEFARQSEKGRDAGRRYVKREGEEEEEVDESREEEEERFDVSRALRELERKLQRLVQVKAEGVDSRLLASCLMGLLDELTDLGVVEDALA